MQKKQEKKIESKDVKMVRDEDLAVVQGGASWPIVGTSLYSWPIVGINWASLNLR